MLDLATLASDTYETAVMVVRHPETGDELASEDGSPVSITLASMDSDKFRKAKNAIINRRLRDQSGQPMTAEKIEDETLDGLAAVTVAWAGVMFEGRTLDCTPDNVKSLYRRLPWLREQVDRFVGVRGNFMKPSGGA